MGTMDILGRPSQERETVSAKALRLGVHDMLEKSTEAYVAGEE